MLLTSDQQDQRGASVVFSDESAVLACDVDISSDSEKNFLSIYCIRDLVTLHAANVKFRIC
jgi:hypothetical protein